MYKKIVLCLSLILTSFFCMFFSADYQVSGSDSHEVYVDYNLSDISQYLPYDQQERLQNFITYVDDGGFANIPNFTQTMRSYYRCQWSVDEEAIDLSTYAVHKDITICANWTPIEYQIDYFYMDGEEGEITNFLDYQTYTIEDGAIYYYIPERPHYRFVDWYTSHTLSDNYLSKFKTAYTIGTVTLFPKWEAIEYKINYNTDAYNVDNPPSYNIENQGFDLAEPRKDGHIFKGWYLDKEYTNKCVRIDKSFSGDLNLYPLWEKEVYNVTYILPDGDKTVVKVPYGEKCSLPDIDKNIFQIVKTDVSRNNITEDTTINIRLVNIWYVYLIGIVMLLGIIATIILVILKRHKNMKQLRYIYNSSHKNKRRWK